MISGHCRHSAIPQRTSLGHESLYLAVSQGGTTRQLFVPKAYEPAVRQWVADYHRAAELMEEISRLGWETALDAVSDRRRRPQIPTWRIVRALVVMFLCRLGSLNALGQSRPSRF